MQRTLSHHHRAAGRTAFETLEGRTLFALAVTPFVDADSGAAGLRIVANPLPGTTNDTLTITEDPDAGTTQVSGTGIPGVLNFGEIQLWDIRTGGGNDSVTWNVTQNFAADNRSVAIDLGTGTDTLNYKMGAAGGGSSVLLDIAGDTGNDTIAVEANDVHTGSRLNVQIEAGAGDDHVTSIVQDLFNDFSQLDVDVDLGSGLNTLDIEIETVADRSRATYDIKGGDSSGTQFDTVNMALTGQLDVAGRLTVNALLGAGNDNMTMDLGPSSSILGEAEVRVDMQGGFGDDALTVRTNQSGAALPIEGVLDINQVGGNGNDTLSVDLRKGAVFNDNDGIDLDGLLRIRQQGQSGNDTLNSDLLFTSGSTGWADVLITGDRGKDTANMNLVSIGPVNFVGGYALLDGGADADTRGTIATNVLPSLKVQRFDSGPAVIQID